MCRESDASSEEGEHRAEGNETVLKWFESAPRVGMETAILPVFVAVCLFSSARILDLACGFGPHDKRLVQSRRNREGMVRVEIRLRITPSCGSGERLGFSHVHLDSLSRPTPSWGRSSTSSSLSPSSCLRSGGQQKVRCIPRGVFYPSRLLFSRQGPVRQPRYSTGFPPEECH